MEIAGGWASVEVDSDPLRPATDQTRFDVRGSLDFEYGFLWNPALTQNLPAQVARQICGSFKTLDLKRPNFTPSH